MAMLQGIQGANNIQEKTFGGGSNFAPLPAGGYVCRIINVKVESTPKGAVYIKFQIDVSEGEHAGYFQRRYAADKGSQYGQKWKGVYKIFLPKMDGDNDKYIKDIARYKGLVNMLARSNNIPEPNIEMGYDPDIFKGCTIGVLFREVTKIIEGVTANYTEPAFLCETQKIRSGDFEVPRPRVLDDTSGAGAFAMPSAQQQMGGSVFTAAASQQSAFQQPAQSAFQQPQATATFQQQSMFQQFAQNAPQSSQSAFQQPAPQLTAPAPATSQNAILGDLSDFEEITTNGDVPF